MLACNVSLPTQRYSNDTFSTWTTIGFSPFLHNTHIPSVHTRDVDGNKMHSPHFIIHFDQKKTNKKRSETKREVKRRKPAPRTLFKNFNSKKGDSQSHSNVIIDSCVTYIYLHNKSNIKV